MTQLDPLPDPAPMSMGWPRLFDTLFTVKLGLVNLTRRWLRTSFAVIGIAIGVSAFVAIFSLTQSVEDAIVGLFRDYRGDIIVVSAGAAGTGDSVVKDEWQEELLAAPGVTAAEPYLFKVREATIINDITAFDTGRFREGTDPASDDVPRWSLSASTQVPIVGFRAGSRLLETFEPLDGKGKIEFSGPAAHEAIIGSEVARQFYAHRVPWAPDSFDEFTIDHLPTLQLGGPDQRYRIVGVLENTGTFHDAAVILPLQAAQHLFHMEGSANAYAIFVDKPDLKPAAIAFINVTGENRFEATDSLDYLGRFGRQFVDLRNVLWAIGLIAAAAGAVGVLNTMMANVHERTREIGVLRAVGWESARVARLVLMEAVGISVLGGILGCALGVLEAVMVHVILDPPIPERYSITGLFIGFGLALTLGVIGSLVPTIKAATLRPVEALRYE